MSIFLSSFAALIEGLHLHEAIIRSDLRAVETILKARVDVNLKYKVCAWC